MQTIEAKQIMLDTIKRTRSLHAALALLEWDSMTVAPPKGEQARAEVIGALAGEAFVLETSEAFGEALDALNEQAEGLSPLERRIHAVAYREYLRNRRIPSDLYQAWATDKELSAAAWHRAKEEDDFASFQPHLQKMIDYNREFIRLWQIPGSPYDALLDIYEPGMRTEQLDPVFDHLLAETREILGRIPSQPAPAPLVVAEESQRAIGQWLLEEIGFDLKAGNLFPTEHPFTCTVHHGDVRLTTKYIPEHPESSIFSVLHEGGHGLYEQNVDGKLRGTNLADGASMGMHESQSRLWENLLGRSMAFWQSRIGRLSELSGGVIPADAQAFYRRINQVRPSLIRIEADELTYNLHIIVRYQIERRIFNEGIDADALPALWNSMYQEYLGVVPPNDTQGILQDVHWSQGSFGYFPTYSLGNLYGAQIAATMEKRLGSFESLAGNGEGLGSILSYLKENLYRYGMEKEPGELLTAMTGETLNPSYLTDYLRRKYSAVYGL